MDNLKIFGKSTSDTLDKLYEHIEYAYEKAEGSEEFMLILDSCHVLLINVLYEEKDIYNDEDLIASMDEFDSNLKRENYEILRLLADVHFATVNELSKDVEESKYKETVEKSLSLYKNIKGGN